MKTSGKLFTISTLACSVWLLTQPTQAQTLAKNEDWLQKQFNKLVTDENKKETPKFTFKGCQMNMAVDSKEKDMSVGVNMAWQLRDVRKVSYKKEKNGQYTLLLDVPADKIKMAMNMGGFSGSFNTDGKDNQTKDNTTSLNLETTDESLVKQIKRKLEESAQLCRQGN